mgnify:CR=1 FL=1
MKEINVQDAVGHALVHDIVRIVIGEVKDTPFRRGHVITEADVPKLLDLGKEHIYVMEPEDEGFLHEEDVARALYDIAKGDYMHDGPMAQGKIEAIADVDGLLKVDVDKLYAINSIGELTIVTKLNNTPVTAGDKIAGMRCIPLLLEEQQITEAQKIGGPILSHSCAKQWASLQQVLKYLKDALKMRLHLLSKNVAQNLGSKKSPMKS